MITYDSLSELAKAAEAEGISVAEVVLRDQAGEMEISPEQLTAIMDQRLSVMIQSAARGEDPALKSNSGLTGGEAALMAAYTAGGNTIGGSFTSRAMSIALAVAGCNAAMGKIVASPTAGSCGILPAALLTAMEQRQIPREKIVSALFTASGIGMVIARTASISGAEGGCQAECGSAAAMAAAALCELFGGTPEMTMHAAALAIKNLMGLVCDPVAGLVEVPCIKRNAGGVMIAIAAADMVLAGIRSKIPPDEVLTAMKAVGDSMPCALRETAQGGLAATPCGSRIVQDIFSSRT